MQDAHLLFALVMNVLYQQEERYQTRHGRGGEGGQHLRLSRRHQRVGSPSMATFTELLRDAHASALPPLEATGWVCFLVENSFSSWSLSLSWLSLQVSACECTWSCQRDHSFPSLPGQSCSLTLKSRTQSFIHWPSMNESLLPAWPVSSAGDTKANR